MNLVSANANLLSISSGTNVVWTSGRLDQVWAVLLHYEKMKRGEAKAISSMLNIHYFSIDPSLQTEIVPMIPVSKLG